MKDHPEETAFMKDHPMKDHPQETILKKDHPDERPLWWKTTLKRPS